jgi:hypothetical protein
VKKPVSKFAFQVHNLRRYIVGQVGMKLFLGVITSSTGMVVEAIKDLNDDTKLAHQILSKVLPILVPHYSLGKGLYDLGQNKLNGSRMRYNAQTGGLEPVGVKDWWSEDVIGGAVQVDAVLPALEGA